ncbi:MAG: hypothetical protein NC127_07165 [Muribaculum sp.]|nr:hypothetical protein [Muribaculum sp.]
MKYAFKHLQSLVAVALCVIMSLTFASCSDDDDEPEESELANVVVGTWAQDGDNDILTVNANGTGVWYNSPQDYQNNQVATTFLWRYNDGWVDVTEDGYMVEKMRAKSVSQNKIVWQRYAIESDGYDPSEDDWDGHDAFGYYDLWTWERYTK